jgi:predicted nucleotide-binding protein
MQAKEYKILVVDDQAISFEDLKWFLEFAGFKTEQIIWARSCSETLDILKREAENIRVAIIDYWLPTGDNPSALEKQFRDGKVGLELAKLVNKRYPHVKIAGFSAMDGDTIWNEYFSNKIHYVHKTYDLNCEKIIDFVKQEMQQAAKQYLLLPNIFIVHGHDKLLLLELKNYIQNVLFKHKNIEPIILNEKPNEGNTIIEKFEKYANQVNLVFVLLTPDDFIKVQANNETYYQARPNVIFELGYFLGKLKRNSGSIIVLSKLSTKMFSDLDGIIFIDITNGIIESSEKIRIELSKWI